MLSMMAVLMGTLERVLVGGLAGHSVSWFWTGSNLARPARRAVLAKLVKPNGVDWHRLDHTEQHHILDSFAADPDDPWLPEVIRPAFIYSWTIGDGLTCIKCLSGWISLMATLSLTKDKRIVNWLAAWSVALITAKVAK